MTTKGFYRKETNCFETVLILLYPVSGYYIGKLVSQHLGILGWIIGFPIGVICSYFIIRLVMLGLLQLPFLHLDPLFPKCVNCGSSYFTVHSEDNRLIEKCPCGAQYEMERNIYYLLDSCKENKTPVYKRKGRGHPWVRIDFEEE